jgi:hypothetical protein
LAPIATVMLSVRAVSRLPEASRISTPTAGEMATPAVALDG